METMTIEQVDVFEKKKKILDLNIPLGQKILKIGFKPITFPQMYERFCCVKIEELEKMKLVGQKRAKNAINENVIIKDVAPYSRDYKIVYTYQKLLLGFVEGPQVGIVIGDIPDWFKTTLVRESNRGFNYFREYGIKCVVKTCELDEYMDDEIPERCLASVECAKKVGIKEIRVAYPAFEFQGVEKLTDPIIYGKAPNGVLVEIDFWE